LFLATPMTTCLAVLCKYIPQLEFIGVLLSDEPVMQSPTLYYQRLIARDQDEAAALAAEFLKTHALEAVYDEVLIPALIAAKRDRALGTLTEEDVHFVIQATRALVEDLGNHQSQPASLSRTSAAPSRQVPAATPPTQILGCPADDEADELALLMLQQALDPTRFTLAIVSAEMLTAEVLSVVEQDQVELICIIALLSGALAPTRYLCKRLRARFPACKIIVGLWGLRENGDEPQALLREAGADAVGTTLRDTQNQLSHWSRLVSTLESSSSPSSSE
jgi:B12 binding domain